MALSRVFWLTNANKYAQSTADGARMSGSHLTQVATRSGQILGRAADAFFPHNKHELPVHV
jgi:hypothetical protein